MATGVDARLLKATKFPPEFNQKVDMTKVNLQVMKKYVQATLGASLDRNMLLTCGNEQMDSRQGHRDPRD